MSAKIAKALHDVMRSCAYVQKTGHNKFHNYKYAGEADLLAVLRPAMIEAGLLLLPSVVECRPVDEHGNTTVLMEYTLVHKDGDIWPHPIRIAGTGNDKNKNGIGDKGTYKALTGANKYLLFKLFQIETGDDPEHDERKPPKADANDWSGNIAETRAMIEADTNGGNPLPSTYDATKAANGGKTPYMVDKEKRTDDWISQQLGELESLNSELAIDEWWKEPERKEKSDWVKKHFPKKYNDLWLTVERQIGAVQRAPRRNVLQAG